MEQQQEYPAWKKAVVEGRRVFVTAFIGVLVVGLQNGIDFDDFKGWAIALAGSALAAGIAAVLKWARETYGQGDYSKLIYKI